MFEETHPILGTRDVHLAVLALERGATLVSAERGFARFPGLDWLDPTAS